MSPPLDLAEWAAAAATHSAAALAEQLGVSAESLNRLGVGRAGETSLRAVMPDWRGGAAWTFPMTTAAGRVAGVRLRLDGGRKLSVRGGHEGLFAPRELLAELPATPEVLWLPEGASDTAALLTLGAVAVGRPSATGGPALAVELVRRLRPGSVVVVADADRAGRLGAESLARRLAIWAPRVAVLTPRRHKDVRAALRAGLRAAHLPLLARLAQPVRLSLTRA